MDTTVKSIRTAIEMARMYRIDAEYVLRRLDEIEWGVDALNAVVEAARAIVADADFDEIANCSDLGYQATITEKMYSLKAALAAVGEGNGE